MYVESLRKHTEFLKNSLLDTVDIAAVLTDRRLVGRQYSPAPAVLELLISSTSCETDAMIVRTQNHTAACEGSSQLGALECSSHGPRGNNYFTDAFARLKLLSKL